MAAVSALERFSFVSWRLLVESYGIADTVYSPYSAFVAVLLATTLAKDSTRHELLQALQWQDANEDTDHIVSALSVLLASSEYADAFYDLEFDAVIELFDELFHEEARGYGMAVKTMLCTRAARQLAPYSFGDIIARVNAERALPGYNTSNDKWPFTRQLRRVMQAGDRSQAFVIRGANQVWPNANLNLDMSEFDPITRGLRVPVQPVVFPQPGVREVNAAVERITSGLIRNLIDESLVSSETSFILTNALYFKASWDLDFDDKATAQEPFNLFSGGHKIVSLMTHSKTHRYLETGSAQFLTLGYAACGYSMLVALPKERDLAAFQALLAEISGELLERAATADTKQVRVVIPKFTARWGSKSLKDILRSLGAREIFEPGVAKFVANSSISEVVQQAFIKINEEGTEAAAATAMFALTSFPFFRPCRDFIANHPFLYFIRNDLTGTILFMGMCIDPVDDG
jgi:serpin B